MSSAKSIVNYRPTEQELIQVKTACDVLKQHLITYKIDPLMAIYKNVRPDKNQIKYTIHEFFNHRSEC